MFSSSSASGSISATPTTIPKINKIQKPAPTPEEEPSQRSTKSASSISSLSKADYINIFKNLTVLFVGNNAFRTLFRDLCQVLKYDRLLDYIAAACQNGEYTSIEEKRE